VLFAVIAAVAVAVIEMVVVPMLMSGVWVWTSVRSYNQQYYVRGDGYVWSETATVNGLLTAGTGSMTAATVAAGGLVVQAGGATVSAGGLSVDDGPSVITTGDNEDALTVGQSASSGYTSTVLTVQAEQTAGAGYELVTVSTDGGGTEVFDVLGTGLVRPQAGLEVTAGGVTVQAGGATITDGGLAVTNAHASDPAMMATTTSGSYTGDMVVVTSAATGSGFDFLRMTADSTDVFTVRGDGRTVITQGGLHVIAGGATVGAGQLMVGDGVTVTSGGLRVVDGGMTVNDGGSSLSASDTNAPVLTVTASATGFVSTALYVANSV